MSQMYQEAISLRPKSRLGVRGRRPWRHAGICSKQAKSIWKRGSAPDTPRNAISFNCSTSRFPLQAEAKMICDKFFFEDRNLLGGEGEPLGPQILPSGVIGSR